MKKNEKIRLKNDFTKLTHKKGISLIVLIVTMIVPYDKMKECCNM